MNRSLGVVAMLALLAGCHGGPTGALPPGPSAGAGMAPAGIQNAEPQQFVGIAGSLTVDAHGHIAEAPAALGSGPVVGADGAGMEPAVMEPNGGAIGYGTLVDLASHAPLAGVPVELLPWTPCKQISPWGVKCPGPVAATKTDSQGKFTLYTVPGHYLLSIGNNVAIDPKRATVHDNVWLSGGRQWLRAPGPCAKPWQPDTGVPHCLLSLPLQWLYKSQTDGSYRLAQLDPKTELPDLYWVNYYRKVHGFAPLVPDEWLVESSRNLVGYFISNKRYDHHPVQGTEFITIGNETIFDQLPGYTPFEQMRGMFNVAKGMNDFAKRFWLNPQVRWTAVVFNNNTGNPQCPSMSELFLKVDPRTSFHDLAVPNWP